MINDGRNKDLTAWNKSWENELVHEGGPDGWQLIDRIKMERLVKLVPPRGRVLEIGCGSARLSSYFAGRGYEVVGLDYAWNALLLARRKAEPMAFVQGDAFRLPFADGTFDVVLSTGLLEHFEDPAPIVGEMARVLKPGGCFYSDVVPHKFSIFRLTSYRKPLEIGGEHVFEGAYGPSDIRQWLGASGRLEDVRLLGAGVLPPYGLTRRPPFRQIIFALKPFWTFLEGGFLGRVFGCYYFVSARRKLT